jgi:capsular polysaccharide biosynthesis protein
MRKWLWLILLVIVTLVSVVMSISLTRTPTYEASIKIIVGQERESNTPGSLGSDIQGLQQVTQTMAEAVNSLPIARTIIQQHDLQMTPRDFLRDRLSVQQIAATQFIRVDYRDSSPQRAQQVANTIGEVFSEDVSDISPSTNAITATVWEQAELPEEPVSPNHLLNFTLALIVGVLIGTGLALLLEYKDPSWRSAEALEQISGVPTFGVIPDFTSSSDSKEIGGKDRILQ